MVIMFIVSSFVFVSFHFTVILQNQTVIMIQFSFRMQNLELVLDTS